MRGNAQYHYPAVDVLKVSYQTIIKISENKLCTSKCFFYFSETIIVQVAVLYHRKTTQHQVEVVLYPQNRTIWGRRCNGWLRSRPRLLLRVSNIFTFYSYKLSFTRECSWYLDSTLNRAIILFFLVLPENSGRCVRIYKIPQSNLSAGAYQRQSVSADQVVTSYFSDRCRRY